LQGGPDFQIGETAVTAVAGQLLPAAVVQALNMYPMTMGGAWVHPAGFGVTESVKCAIPSPCTYRLTAYGYQSVSDDCKNRLGEFDSQCSSITPEMTVDSEDQLLRWQGDFQASLGGSSPYFWSLTTSGLLECYKTNFTSGTEEKVALPAGGNQGEGTTQYTFLARAEVWAEDPSFCEDSSKCSDGLHCMERAEPSGNMYCICNYTFTEKGATKLNDINAFDEKQKQAGMFVTDYSELDPFGKFTDIYKYIDAEKRGFIRCHVPPKPVTTSSTAPKPMITSTTTPKPVTTSTFMPKPMTSSTTTSEPMIQPTPTPVATMTTCADLKKQYRSWYCCKSQETRCLSLKEYYRSMDCCGLPDKTVPSFENYK